MTEKEVLAQYEELNGLLTGHFLLSSGLHSNKYLQTEKVLQHPEIAAKIIAPLVKKLDMHYSTVVSPAIGGIRFGYELARQAEKRTLFTERVEKEMVFRRGFELEKGEKVVIAEDVVTTGKSTKECIDAVIKAGGDVVAVVSIIDRSNDTADFGVPYHALAKVQVEVWNPDECPLCKQGSTAVKPGSRK